VIAKAFRGYQPGTLVEDVHFTEWGTGVVVGRSKTRLYIQFFRRLPLNWADKKGIMCWDGPHVRKFLRKAT
jgi:hypothetical protein